MACVYACIPCLFGRGYATGKCSPGMLPSDILNVALSQCTMVHLGTIIHHCKLLLASGVHAYMLAFKHKLACKLLATCAWVQLLKKTCAQRSSSFAQFLHPCTCGSHFASKLVLFQLASLDGTWPAASRLTCSHGGNSPGAIQRDKRKRRSSNTDN